ncbi:MAG TPA: carbohydrate binding domain-containing protein [Marinagarivorans sp.]
MNNNKNSQLTLGPKTPPFSALPLRRLAIVTAAIALCACVADPVPDTNSSAPAQTSSSEVSVPQSSSSAVVSSSSVAPVSSSAPASSAPVSSSSSSEAPQMAAGPGTENTLLNSTGEFESGMENFTTYDHGTGDNDNTTPALTNFNWDSNGALEITVNDLSTAPWHVQLIHDTDIRLGLTYTLCYDAMADVERVIEVDIDTPSTYTSVVNGAIDVTLGTTFQRYTHTFTGAQTAADARVLFNLGIEDGDVTFDNIGLYHGTMCNQVSMIPPPPEPGEPDPSAGCGQAPGQLGSQNNGIPIGNAGNAYYVTLPQNYDRNKAYPLFFVHHPSGGSGLTWGENSAGFSNEAKANGIFVYPKAININGGWHGNDFQMFEPLYNRITNEFCVNKAAVFATGYSSGGDYSGMLGCEHADKITAIAPTNTKPLGGGQYPLNNPSSRSCSGTVKAVILHNERDTLVGGTHGKLMADFYRAKNGCSNNTVPYPGYSGAGQQCVTYQGCEAGAEVSYCSHNASYGTPPTNHGYPSFTGNLLWEIAKEIID